MSSRPPLGAAKVKRQWRGDKRHCHTKSCLLKSGGRKNLPLPYDLLGVMGYFPHPRLHNYFCFATCIKNCLDTTLSSCLLIIIINNVGRCLGRFIEGVCCCCCCRCCSRSSKENQPNRNPNYSIRPSVSSEAKLIDSNV